MEIEKLQQKYYGDMADTYESVRQNDKLWQDEDAAIADLLSALLPFETLLDVPVGTGRFLPLYKRLGVNASGIDASAAMLDKAVAVSASQGTSYTLRQGSIFQLDFPNRAFDAVLCMRFLNWLELPDVGRALLELKRVSKGPIICSLRSYTPLADFQLATPSGWRRLMLQYKRRFYHWRNRREENKHIIHDWDDAKGVIHASGLEIADSKLLIQRRDGVDYHVLTLRRH